METNYFEYNEFSNVRGIGQGAFGAVNGADWKSCGINVALKILKNNNSSINTDGMNKFLKELKFLRQVSFHPNINQFFGITKDPLSNNYMMVLQYANHGNLREYLENNFRSLQWKDKIRMALDMTCGLKCLHSRKIIHRDLHAKNILVHYNKLMIADLGLSKQLTAEITQNSIDCGMPAYVEPQYYKNGYIRDEKSDIYSLGVLLWEVTSGHPPFPNVSNYNIIVKINKGFREQPVTGTPSDYVNLYQKCWDDDPNSRPTIGEVFDKLEKISSQFNEDNCNVVENLYRLNLNNEAYPNSTSQRNSQSQSSLNSTHTNNQINTSLSDIPLSTVSSSVNVIIQAYLKYNNIGWTRDFNLDKVLERYKSNSQNIFNYLISNQNMQHYEVMLGIFYSKEFGIHKIDESMVLELYTKASQKNDINGHYEVGNCYNIKRNFKRAVAFYQRAANNGLNIALYHLAYCYKYGKGIQEDKFKAFELYKKSAENGFIPSQFELAKCCRYGEGTVKNNRETLKWYISYQGNGGIIDVSNKIKKLQKKCEQV